MCVLRLAWNDRYAAYAQLRHGVEQAAGASDADRWLQVNPLRARMFADLSEVLRAYVVDKAPADEGGAC